MNKIDVLVDLIRDRLEFARIVNSQIQPLLLRWAFVLRDTPTKWHAGGEEVITMLDQTISILASDIEDQGQLEEVLRAMAAWPTEEQITTAAATEGFGDDQAKASRARNKLIHAALVKCLLARPQDAEHRWARNMRNKLRREKEAAGVPTE